VRGEFSQKFSMVCAARVGSRSSFGDVVCEAVWPWRDAGIFSECDMKSCEWLLHSQEVS